MAYATVVTVNLEGRDRAAQVKMLQEVIAPRLKGSAGFQSARFLNSLDGTQGVGASLFDTEANAKAALEAATSNRPPDAPPVVSTAIYEVVLEI